MTTSALLAFASLATVVGADLICPDRTSCKEETTCCPDRYSGFGCCGLVRATCCPDRAHCCPRGYACDGARGTCVMMDNPLLVQPTMIAEPLTPGVRSPRLVVCEQTPERDCEDGELCCYNTPPSLTNVTFGGCAPGYGKCCNDQLEGTYVGWCPDMDGECCADNRHCCPLGFSCSPDGLNCIQQQAEQAALLAPSFQPISPEQKLLPSDFILGAVQCTNTGDPNPVYCADGFTCCAGKGGKGWLCCPMDNAVCCSDHESCCPSGTKCDLATGLCMKNSMEDAFLRSFQLNN